MKVRGWSIDGFGLSHDFTVSNLPDGLTVLYGANEVGKSTLLELLRRVLFGMPPDSSASCLAPLPGRPHRARVTIAAGAEQLVIERVLDRPAPPRLRRPDGRAIDAGELPRLLGGADARLFRAVFTCTLADLQSLAGLDAEGVRDALFSASLAGASRSARAAVQALHARAATCLDGDGTAQINRLIGELNGLRPRLNDARRAALAYDEQLAAADRAAAAVAAQHALLAARRAARARDEALLRAWPAWQALQATRAGLAGIEPVEDVPADVEAELRAATGRLAAAQGAVQTLRSEQAEVERLAAAPSVPAVAEAEVEALSADLPLHRFQLAMLPGARARCADAEQQLAGRLRRAGADWSVERLRAWGGDAGERDRVRDWQARLRAAGERIHQARWQWETARTACEAARRERDLTVAEVAAHPSLAPEEIAQQRQILGEIRAAIEEMLARRARGEATVQALQEREHALQVLEAGREPPPPGWLAPLFGGAAVAGGLAVVWAVGTGAPLAGLGAFGVAALSGAAARWALQWRRAHAQRQAQRQIGRRAVHSEIEAARRTRDAEWHRAAQLAERIARQAQQLGLSRIPSAIELAARERAIDDAAMAAARMAAACARLAELESLLRQRVAEEASRAAEAAAAAAASASLEAEWSAWAAAAGFSADAAPEAVLDRVAILEAAEAALATFDTAMREVDQIESVVATWEARARAALESAGAERGQPLAGHALIERVLALRLRRPGEALRRTRHAELDGALRARLQAAEAEVERCRQHVASVFAAAGARDEADLLRRRGLAERRRSLQRAIAEQERAVRERLGDEQTLAVLTTGALETWQQRAAAADEEVGELEQDLYQRVAEQRELRAACRAAEESADVASLEIEWTALMAELGDAVREWRVLAAAEGLIDDARQAFERTRQPAVLRAASSAFTAVTGGRYERVAQDDVGERLVVVEPGGRRKQVGSELSRGTTEQLYLSIRLGLAQEFNRRGVALPLLLDDVLVNFDPERARAMAEVLGAFAREQQVLFATCHPGTRDLLVEHGHADRLIEL
jgi:uncharacterized protein YhaN